MKFNFPKILILSALAALSAQPALAQTQSTFRAGALYFYDGAEMTESMANVAIEAEFSEVLIGDATPDFAFSAVNSGAASIVAATNGTMRLTTGGADNDDAELASQLMFTCGNFAAMEARVRVNEPTAAFNVGFTDAQSEAADLLPITISGVTPTSTASNAALVIGDYDQTTNTLKGMAVNDDTDSAQIDSGVTFAEDTWYTIRVELESDGTARFWVNGNSIGAAAAGVDNRQTLAAYVGLINRSGAAQTMDVDYIRVWQRRIE